MTMQAEFGSAYRASTLTKSAGSPLPGTVGVALDPPLPDEHENRVAGRHDIAYSPDEILARRDADVRNTSHPSWVSDSEILPAHSGCRLADS